MFVYKAGQNHPVRLEQTFDIFAVVADIRYSAVFDADISRYYSYVS